LTLLNFPDYITTATEASAVNDIPFCPPASSDGPLGDRPHLTGTIDTGLRQIVPADGPESGFALTQQVHFWTVERKCALANLHQAENAMGVSLHNSSLAQARGDERGRDAWLARAAHHAHRIKEHVAWIAQCDGRMDDIRGRLAALAAPAPPREITLPLIAAAE
jgi:hypothetical protein